MTDNNSFRELGFYGKLPTYGDFIQKRLPQDFINPWHEWLQSGMLAVREHEPENWLSYYLNCPAWCFVLGAGICGSQPVAGVTIPSVDKVGRYFNFPMASILPEETEPASFASSHYQWVLDIKDLALEILDEELDQQSIEEAITSNSLELSYSPGPRANFENEADQLRVVYPEDTLIKEQLPGLLHHMILRDQNIYGLWWHKGSSQVSAQTVICANMPSTTSYLGLMMDEDLVEQTQSPANEQEVDYIDDLLSS
ncbi:MAG: type VI secretion system-associated protein TagF [Xanthomonadales bacterium]|nr:type VI secretion system-associated protein TagF [Xanthomonadales bacterium]